MISVDSLVVNAGQLATCASPCGPKRSHAMMDVGLIEDGALAVFDGSIVALGTTAEILAAYEATDVVDAAGRVVCPGFVDPHTHAVFAGDRVHEFEMRLKGASYMEIMATGGGIVSTVRHTREASTDDLFRAAFSRLDKMLALGTTTAEIKTGYGLDLTNEMKMLQVIERLHIEHALDVVPTFLGAHTTPPDFQADSDRYMHDIMYEMLPEVASWYRQSKFYSTGVPLYCDVFLEDHAFNLDQSRRLLTNAQKAGLPSKMHADQFNSLGGVPMAVELGAVSVDHLEVTTEEDIHRLGKSDTIAVLLPAVNFNLGADNFADGRALLDSDAIVAVATDLNPGSAPCFSMPLVMAIGARYNGLMPAEALNAATINAAYAIGLGDRVGSIEVGKQADLLILDATDYRELTYLLGANLVQTVMKKGKIVYTS